jgi:hypothetical protein
MSLYVFKSRRHPGLALGVTDAQAGAKLTLLPIRNTPLRKILWSFIPSMACVRIALYGTSALVWDLDGPYADATPVVLKALTPSMTQCWEVLTDAGKVICAANPDFGVGQVRTEAKVDSSFAIFTPPPALPFYIVSLSSLPVEVPSV